MNNLCALGFQLSEKAAIADRDFKAHLLEFFSAGNRKDDDRRRQLEALGVQQREADDAFLRHYRGCMNCRETAGLMHRSA
jgi:hypothetical protein